MILKKLNLTHFRNYNKENIVFKPGTNILFGKNGQGKTNILESIYYLSLTKSFRTNTEQNLILNTEDFFRIQGQFLNEQDREMDVSIAYSPTDGKRLTYNNQRVLKFSDYIGQIPIVLLAPSDLEISQGGPYRRRQFLDIMLSQASQLYLHHQLQFRRALKQRNQLLQEENVYHDVLNSWDEALVQQGTLVIEKRLEAIEKLDSIVKEYYKLLSGTEDKVKLVYRSSFPLKDAEDIAIAFRNILFKQREKDLQLKTTTIGPHRDDILFLINGKALRWVGSQGEHKTFIISLKMAEYQFLRNIQHRLPLLLFDDIFGELDAGRITNMISTLSEIGQVFITTTSPYFWGKIKSWEGNTSFYEIESGRIREAETV
ncbi:MAG: DNA replication/repair protein RecF [Calditrichaeota bacterium]|nr:DNA replication/repair protein RecF [Calditrichota bacterium]RQV93508.1 MAG: DNA replication/repair protein RecF [bacterium]RQW06422.1 MAG: DNA replication/repair protein RecF [Calditrichota bacterium]